ncbi:hypothetical protein Tco_0610602 [Tanacetum coccineum]
MTPLTCSTREGIYVFSHSNDDKRKVTRIKILDDLEQRIENVEKHLNKAKEKIDLNKRKEKMDLNKGKEKMVMEREVIIIELDTSSNHNHFQVTYDESSDDNPFQVTSDESTDHNLLQVTSDESSDDNPFQVSTDDILKSSSEYTCSSDATREQKKTSKSKPRSSSTKAKKRQ